MPSVIELRGVTKRFPGVVANNNVDLTLEAGEIHALLGENGAGKSTLMNIVYGLYKADEGEILVEGEPVHFDDPNDAIRHGIGMVHQHFMLVPVMTVAENIMLGEEETTGRFPVTLAAAIVIGAVLGYLLGSVIGLVFWLLAGGLFAVLHTAGFTPPMGRMQFGVLVGLGLGIVFDVLSAITLETTSSALMAFWPLVGAVLGGLANLRWLDRKQVAEKIRAVSEEYGLPVDPEAYISDLPVGVQQRAEIVKALYRDARILILDEPTAVLTPQEADDLFKVMRRLTQRGVSIIFITHKLREVLAVADRITVLRRGEVVGTTRPEESTRESLAEMMVGREVVLKVDKAAAHPGEDVLTVSDLHVLDDRGQTAVDGVSFAVRAGEIVGVAGVQGNGQSELVESITGLRAAKSGSIRVLASEVVHSHPRAVTALGTAHIPEDRQKHGLVLTYPVADNLVLADYYRPPFSRGVVMDDRSVEENAERLVKEFDVRTPSVYTSAGKLSGGNQQKVIVARELSRGPKLLIAAQPTRGLDVGSIEFIHQQIIAARDAGAGVLLVSAELDEILSLSDRIIVMYQGHIMADMPAEQATREKLGLLMAGVRADAVPAGAAGGTESDVETLAS